ncbi:hypothetical protein [Chengkuizengella axinellae]|uniref:Lipoprotein n=1 Tax=Chengkuizengella axinellae TaxID=3064388 RepID=A0ABT9J148_9BACL|nr:hypothetical protein [Chengkuizengella sp. 2205SS18-9]MDP5275332.1 hypothetical protein [Chengkuizengella sp. 2205SS18-9]
MKTMKTTYFIHALIIMALLTSCNYREEYTQSEQNLNERTLNEMSNIKMKNVQGQDVKTIDAHENTSIRFSPFTAKEIMDIPGISHSYVILTNRNAYVSLVLDHTATGGFAKGNIHEQNNSGKSDNGYNENGGITYTSPKNLVTDTNSKFTLEDENNISSRLKEKVIMEVKKLNPRVDEIYVSANRAFVNQLNVYAQKTWRGNSLKPYVNEFNESVKIYFQ